MKKKIPLLCRLFGHKRIGRGWWGDGLYGRVTYDTIDNLGTMHFSVHDDCHRNGCNERFRVARFHHHRVLEAIQRWHPEKLDQPEKRT